MRLSPTTGICCLSIVCSLAGIAAACTCFCFDTPDGPIFGANLDLFFPGDGLVFINRRGIAKEGFDAGTTGNKAQWISSYGSVTFNLAGREWAFGGMNEAGLVVGSMELLAATFPEPDERPPLPIGPWAQYVLDTCGNVEEAIQVDSKVRIHDPGSPIHYLIADADGHCVAIEWLDGQFVSYTGDSLPVKAMSNMPYALALAALRRGGAPPEWLNPGESAERFAAAHARCVGFDAGRDTSTVGYALDTLTRMVAAPHTKWSIVYDIAKREVWYRSEASPTVKHLSLGAFDLACDAPLLMLDVNAAIEGDVTQAFMPYDHDTNLVVFRRLVARYGVHVPKEDAIAIVRHIERFACAP